MNERRYLPPIDAGGSPPPRTACFDARTADYMALTEAGRTWRPKAGRLPRKGNTGQRAARRAQERAASKAVRR